MFPFCNTAHLNSLFPSVRLLTERDSVTRSHVFQVIDLKSLDLPEHIFNSFLRHFHALILKKYVFAVSHLTVTVRIINDSFRSAPVINSHLPID
jgi:hypothetical protein